MKGFNNNIKSLLRISNIIGRSILEFRGGGKSQEYVRRCGGGLKKYACVQEGEEGSSFVGFLRTY